MNQKSKKLAKLLLATAIIVGAFSFNSSIAQADDVQINETNFPDNNFRELLKGEKYDKNKDGKFSPSEIKDIKELNLSRDSFPYDSKIDKLDVKGIENFTELENLNLSGMSLEKIDLSKNTKLKKLDVGFTGLTKLDLSKNTELQDLDISFFSSTQIDLSNNTKLKNLKISRRSELTSLDLTKNTELVDVEIMYSPLSSLKLGNNSKLEKLTCIKTGIGDLNLKNCTALKELDCSYSSLASLDVSNNKKLTALNCVYNVIMPKIEFGDNANLTNLMISGNPISDLDLSKLTKLKKLYVDENYLGKIDLKNNTDLETLSCDKTNLRDLDVSKLTKLKYLSCKNNNLNTLNLKNNTLLEELYCDYNRISNLDLSNNILLKQIDCTNNILEKLDLSNKSLLKFVKCHDNLLKNLNVNSCSSLEELDCSYNKLENLDITSNYKLLELKCSKNLLTNLNLEKSTGLKSLYCGDNRLSNLDFSKTRDASLDLNNPTLQELDIEINKEDNSFDLTKLPGKFDATKVSNLKSATIDKNKLTVDKDAKTVTFDYNINSKNKLKVTMNVKFSDKDEAKITRISGYDRIATAIEVSKKKYKEADTVIIARSDIYPDSLAASSLACKLKAPILLTESDNLDNRVKSEIVRLKAKNVIIVGGINSITRSVENSLIYYDKDSDIERIAGDNRYETSAALAEKLIKVAGNKNTAIIASGENFADALTAGAYAAGENYPILLVQKYSINEKVAKVINDNKINKTILAGGVNSISEYVKDELPNDTQRIAGKNRYETSAKIADKLFKAKSAYVASGEVFADALVASPVAASQKMPILLVSKYGVSKEVKDYVNKNIDHNLVVVGGEKSIPNFVVSELGKAKK